MARRKPQPHMITRLARLHARLLLSIAVGIAALAVLPGEWRVPTRLLGAWDIGVALYLVLTSIVVMRCDIDAIRRRAAAQDEGAWVILVLAALTVLASLAAIIAFLSPSQAGHHTQSMLQGSFAALTILLSWSFVHTIFALHYAHEYYGDRGDQRIGGLNFPGKHPPDYLDFVYFSLVIAMTSQVSDVAIASKAIRRVATLQGVLSFFFNLSILALTVNMLASAL